ncbi:hypothetical protein LMG31506_00202 [Cupriavidus yeoncheonensis]|uniref:Uncharacterized protein n=1 Tax=Cupriavidus yeoncheonensis TaxID=1462994 RepID=A0A916IP83_9BURK|nr:hypothetical protein [Cupriavidus yeoncheonensis]CAG2126847.1 hypothetical protein LMG31506_00202 [Cupriavidus yeoncheonensis]
MVSEVRERHRPNGSGGIYSLRGKSLQAVEQRARERCSAIDAMRSPSIGLPRKDGATGDHIVEVRYYGV